MKESIKIIEEALTLYGTDEQGTYLHGAFYDLSTTISVNQKELHTSYAGATLLFSKISQDVWNIATLTSRLEWSRSEAKNIQHLMDSWRYYAAVDIEHFHVEIRSIMDYLAVLIGIFSGKKGQLPPSFMRLLERKDDLKPKIGDQISGLLENSDWFRETRAVRDAIVHTGGNTLIFGSPEEGILFQVYKDFFHNMVNKPCFMFNENVAYFDKYVALFFSQMIVMLEKFAQIVGKGIEVTIPINGVHSYAPGFSVIRQWTVNLLTELKQEATSKRPVD